MQFLLAALTAIKSGHSWVHLPKMLDANTHVTTNLSKTLLLSVLAWDRYGSSSSSVNSSERTGGNHFSVVLSPILSQVALKLSIFYLFTRYAGYSSSYQCIALVLRIKKIYLEE